MKKTKNPTELNQILLLERMVEWAFGCGDILNKHLISSYKKPLKILNKGKMGLATEADLLSEEFIIKKIRKHYPDHAILSEEDAFKNNLVTNKASEIRYQWLIDPLDGTNNFYNRVPFFCVSLAVTDGEKTLAGVVYNPVTCELFYALQGQGAYFVRMVGKKQIKMKLGVSSKKKKFSESLLSANLTSKRVEKMLFDKFPQVRAMRRMGSAALELSYVAAGMLDAYWEYQLQPWDLAAAGLICEEAGVKVSTLKGEKYHPFCQSVLATHPSLYSELKSILSP